MVNFSFLDKQDTFSVLLSTIYAGEADEEYRMLSDLMLCLDNRNFKKVLALFEGQTIKIPPIHKIAKMLQAMLLYAYLDVEKLKESEAYAKAGVPTPGAARTAAVEEYKRFKSILKSNNVQIGGVLDGFPSDKTQILK